MTPEALLTAALQLEAGWKVVECRWRTVRNVSIGLKPVVFR